MPNLLLRVSPSTFLATYFPTKEVMAAAWMCMRGCREVVRKELGGRVAYLC